jgi:hypothetical protein
VVINLNPMPTSSLIWLLLWSRFMHRTFDPTAWLLTGILVHTAALLVTTSSPHAKTYDISSKPLRILSHQSKPPLSIIYPQKPHDLVNCIPETIQSTVNRSRPCWLILKPKPHRELQSARFSVLSPVAPPFGFHAPRQTRQL